MPQSLNTYTERYGVDAEERILAGVLSLPELYLNLRPLLHDQWFDDTLRPLVAFIHKHHDEFGALPTQSFVEKFRKRPFSIPEPGVVHPDWLAQEVEDHARYKARERIILDGVTWLQSDRMDLFDQAYEDSKRIGAGPKEEFSFVNAADIAWSDIPPTPWLYGERLVRGEVSVLTGAGGVGKTAVTTTVAVSLATGRNLVDPANADPRWLLHEPNPLRVYLYNLEDGLMESQRRVLAVLNHHGMAPRDLGDNLVLGDGTAKRLVVAICDRRTNQVARQACVEPLIAKLKQNAIDVLVLDPLVKAHKCVENDNDQMDEVMSTLKQVAIRANCALWVVHHSGKSGTTVDPNGSRGATAIVSAARVCEALTKPAADEQAHYGLEGLHVRLDATKSNLSPAAANENTQWLRLDGVAVGNATPLYPKGDYRQAITLVKPQAQTARMEVDLFDRICGELRDLDPLRPVWGKSRQCRNPGWAGSAFKAAGMTDKQAGALVKEWQANGLLREVSGHNADKDERGRVVGSYFGLRLDEDRVREWHAKSGKPAPQA